LEQPDTFFFSNARAKEIVVSHGHDLRGILSFVGAVFVALLAALEVVDITWNGSY